MKPEGTDEDKDARREIEVYTELAERLASGL